MSCLVWCDECCGENWEDVSRWIHNGMATAKSGRLKAERECDGCGVVMPAGSSAEAVTLHFECRHLPWEDDVLECGTGWEEIEGGDERPGRGE